MDLVLQLTIIIFSRSNALIPGYAASPSIITCSRSSDESCSYRVASSAAERSAMPSDFGVRKASAL